MTPLRGSIAAACIAIGVTFPAALAQDDGAATPAPAAAEAPPADEQAQPQRGPRGPRGDGGGFQRGPRGGENDPGEGSNENGDGLVSVSFNNAELRQIAQFFMRQLNKPVIINDEVQNTRITILSDQRMPPRQAMELIGNALRAKGVMIIESAHQIDFLPVAQARLMPRPVVPAGVSVATLENQSQIVDKVFELKHYDATRLQTVVTPMLPEWAFTFVDPAQNKLTVTDAAASLRRIEELVAGLDVPRATQTVERIFRLEHGDASEIVSMLRVIVAGTLTGDQSRALLAEAQITTGGPGGQANRGGRPQPARTSAPPAGANTILAQQNDTPILLQADLSRNWIIAVASPSVMDIIERWVKELDRPKEANEPYVLIDVKHADITELAAQLTEAINSMPDADVRNSVRVVPFPKSRRLMVYGSQRGRLLVEQLLNELDVEAAQFRIFKEIPLRYAAAESVASQIEELFSDSSSAAGRGNPFGFFGGAQTSEAELRVTYDTRRNSITIMTDPIKLEQIERLLAEQWDRPIDLDSVQPKIYYLKYTDPSQVQTLLQDMFSAGSSTSTGPWWNPTTSSTSPSGRLGGQFTFQALAGTNILTVTSSAQENYAVIDRVLEQIDRPQEAGLPLIIELKHANAEDVAEQLNAMFSEPGTPSAITRNERGLSRSLREGTTAATTQQQGGGGQGQQNQQNQQNQNQVQAGSMGFWWAQSNRNLDEVPTSNLIGKPRFVPVNRRNALMILAPQGYMEPLQALVAELDKPGSQVLIQAIIAEVQHDDESTLGLRLASDPSIFADSRLADSSIGGSVGGEAEGTRAFDGFFSGTGVIGGDINLNFLIQLLVRKVNLKIMNEPRVYTSDNEEAHFFDGQDVPFVSGDQTSVVGGGSQAVTRSFENREVGTRLHVRPHITQEGDVNLEVNLELSNLVSGQTVFGNFIVNRRSTTTNITLKDGQTVVISGLIRKEDVHDVRKLPILGDIPILGVPFRSTEKGLRNREVVAFITPRIVNPAEEAAKNLSDDNKAWLQRLRDAIGGGNDNGQLPPTDMPAGMQTEESAGADAITPRNNPTKTDEP